MHLQVAAQTSMQPGTLQLPHNPGLQTTDLMSYVAPQYYLFGPPAGEPNVTSN